MDFLENYYRLLWNFLDFYGLLWTFYGLLWTFMDFYGLLWIFMDFYGLLCEFWKISIFDQKRCSASLIYKPKNSLNQRNAIIL